MKGDMSHDTDRKEGDVLDAVGGDGPWQRRIIVALFLSSVPLAMHNLCITFYAPYLDHWCARPPQANLSIPEWKAIALPSNDSQCYRYKDINLSIVVQDMYRRPTNDVIACDSWEYDDSLFTSTILSEWNLVCDHEWFISLSKSIFIAGFFFSVLVSGYLADRFGRRPVIAVCNVIGMVSAVACAFSPTFLMFAVSRFFVAVGVAGTFNTSFVLLMEIIGPAHRSFYGIAVNAGWVLGYVALPAVAYGLRDWFWMQVVITVPNVLLLPSWWMICESPRWLLLKGRRKEAMALLMRAGEMNGADMNKLETVLKEVTQRKAAVSTEKSNANFLHLFARGLWPKTVVIFYLWVIISFVYFGISYNTNELAGNMFLNFALYGLVEIPSNVFSYFVIKSRGRRIPLAVSLACAGASCLLIYPIPEDSWWLGLSLSLAGKFFIACAFSIVYVATAEIFPTVVRNVGVGSSSMVARVGTIVAPFVKELGDATHPVVPQVVFGVLAATGGFLVLLLPETNNQSVPDTVEEAVNNTRKENKR